jgi:SAM-dependent methyltransferase
MVNCRGCGAGLNLTFLDLGMSPIANDLIPFEKANEPEEFYPLHVLTCLQCALVQLPEVASREALFRSDYVYFSSYSSTWLEHSQRYVTNMIELLKLNSNDLVIEVASNDGYLLQYFTQAGVQVLGVEPSAGVAQVAIEKGIDTVINFFGARTALELPLDKKPKLMLGNNVLAHVPDLHDFIEGFAILIADEGLITFEFPHLVNLIKNNQFDTIYHEHFSYLSVTSLLPIFESHGLKVVQVEKLITHGGSIRIYVAKSASSWEVDTSVVNLLTEESDYDPREESVWRIIQSKALQVKEDLVKELQKCQTNGIKVGAYGAAAKGNTLLNYSGITSTLVEYVIDLNPHKQGNYLPGSKIPIVGPDELMNNPPEVLLVLPWNLAEEIKNQLSKEVDNGMKLLRAIPNLEYF